MRAPSTSIDTFTKASPEAVFVRTDKVLPFSQTFPVPTRTSEDQPSDWVARTRGTMGIQFTTFVTRGNVDLGKVTVARNLDELWRLEEVCTVDRTVRNETRSVPGLETVRDENLELQQRGQY